MFKVTFCRKGIVLKQKNVIGRERCMVTVRYTVKERKLVFQGITALLVWEDFHTCSKSIFIAAFFP